MGLAYAFLWGIIAIDLAMTWLPHWFSTMFPVAFFIGAFHSGSARRPSLMVVLRRRLGLEECITDAVPRPRQAVFAFAVFWMYINWSQYMVIWYGLLPCEQEYFVQAFKAPFGRPGDGGGAADLRGALPRPAAAPAKKMPEILAGFAALMLVGHWLERFLLVDPSLYDGRGRQPPAAGAAGDRDRAGLRGPVPGLLHLVPAHLPGAAVAGVAGRRSAVGVPGGSRRRARRPRRPLSRAG